jgi:predicted AlkP superfamily pyrophosphatase or phosphodiesterase
VKKVASLFLLCALSVYAAEKKPKLVLTIVIDQFRYDYLTRFRSEFSGGFARLLKQGAVFTDANYQHFPTVTAVGHSTILSGATPAISGIVANEWPDRATGKEHSSVDDDSTVLVGGKEGARGSSPRRLLVSTVGDEMKLALGNRCRVFGVSLKDRSAILPAGHLADAAYWFDLNTGLMTSSNYYLKDKKLPDWAANFNARDFAGKHLGQDWMPPNAKSGDKPYWSIRHERAYASFEDFEKTVWGNEMLEEFAENLIAAENVGRHEATDMLSVSFSSNDILGHKAGIYSPAMHEMTLETDRVVGKLITYAEQRVGKGNLVVVLTADHGVTPAPEEMAQRGMLGGRIPESDVTGAIDAALSGRFGKEKWIQSRGARLIYLDRGLATKHNTTAAEMQRIAAEAVRKMPHIFRVYTATDLAAGRFLGDYIDQRVRNGYNAVEGADLFVVPQPYWIFYTGATATGTDHGLPFKYDTHVPMIFMGEGIRPGEYDMPVAVNDIAPTIATMLSVEIPSGSIGRVLNEMLVH